MNGHGRAFLLVAAFTSVATWGNDAAAWALGDPVPRASSAGGSTTVVVSDDARAEWRCEDGTPVLYVVGTVTVRNDGAEPTEGLQLVGRLEHAMPGRGSWTADPRGFSVAPKQIEPGETLEYEYEFPVSSWNAPATYRFGVSVTLTNLSGKAGPEGPDPKPSVLAVAQPVNLCAVACTLPDDYWQSRQPSGEGSPTGDWPVSSLTLGTVGYSTEQVQELLYASTGARDAMPLVRALIAAKLNIAAGADPGAIATAITKSDELIGGRRIEPRRGFSTPLAVSDLVEALEAYNRGAAGPPACG